MNITRTPLADLTEDPNNARLHGEANLEAIKASLKRWGQVEPLVVQAGTRRVIGGNGRLVAMRDIGWEECDIVEVELEDLESTALGIALNRTAELAEWDDRALAMLLSQVTSLDGVGYDSKAVDAMLAGIKGADTVDPGQGEPPEVAVAKTGDIWVLGDHRMMCGDSTDAEQVAALLDGGKPEMMVTDPPYGVDYDPDWRSEDKLGLWKPSRTSRVANDDRVDWTEAWKLFQGDVVYMWHAALNAAETLENLRDAGFLPRAQIIWHKPRFLISRGHYHWGHEPCWYAVRKGRPGLWGGDRKQSTIWEIQSQVVSGEDDTKHGTQKPLECMERPIRNHTASGIYDPFVGTGTTLLACERTNRTGWFMDIEPAWIDVAIDRWQRATGKKAMLGKKSFERVAKDRA